MGGSTSIYSGTSSGTWDAALVSNTAASRSPNSVGLLVKALLRTIITYFFICVCVLFLIFWFLNCVLPFPSPSGPPSSHTLNCQCHVSMSCVNVMCQCQLSNYVMCQCQLSNYVNRLSNYVNHNKSSDRSLI